MCIWTVQEVNARAFAKGLELIHANGVRFETK